MKIKIFDDLFLLQRVDHLIRTRATGAPAQLASRLGCCERDVYRLIADLRSQGFPISYDRQADTYYYAEPVKLNISIVVGAEKLLSIQGGQKSTDFLGRLTDLGSRGGNLCKAVSIGRFVAGWLFSPTEDMEKGRINSFYSQHSTAFPK